MRFALLLIAQIVSSTCVRVKYFSKNEQHTKVLKDDRITESNLGEDVRVLHVESYEDENQVVEIGDFPQLEVVRLEKIGQKALPRFWNVPKLQSMFLEKNDVRVVEKGQISETGVVYVNLNSNKIRSVEPGSFGDGVRKLWLACNELDGFSPEWFANASALEEIDMSGNLLKRIEPGLFSSFPNVFSIVFNYNELSEVGAGGFGGRENLNFLHLAYNKLEELSSSVFTNNVTVQWMSINNNRLSFLSRELRSKLRINLVAELNNNPWRCRCWEEIELWLPEGSYRPDCFAFDDSTDCAKLRPDILDDYESKYGSKVNTRLNYCGFKFTSSDYGIW